MNEIDISNTKRLVQQHSEEVQDILGDPPHILRRIGGYFLGGFVVTLFIGAWFFKAPQTIDAPIVLSSNPPPSVVKPNLSGRLSELYVTNFEKVPAGKQLGMIENTANKSDIEKMERVLQTIYNALSKRQVCLIDKQDLQLGDLQSNYAMLLTQVESYNQFIEVNQRSHKIATMQHNLQANQQRLEHLKKLHALSSKIYDLQRSSYQRDKRLHSQQYITTEALEQAEALLFQEQMNVENAQEAINTQRIQELLLKTDIEGLLLEYEQQLNQHLIKIRTLLEQIRTSIKKWKMDYLLISPCAGIVSFTDYWSVNQNLEAGKTAFTVIPVLPQRIIGRLYLSMEGAGYVRCGQKVYVSFSNYPESEYGTVEGEIGSISLTPNEENRYVVDVFFPRGLHTSYNKTLPLTYGMTGQSKIYTKSTSLLQNLLQPIKAVFESK
ncbi:MAG: HlyD family efflux transporter periplasmic adaptor subunit [Alloprevotella sp.]|nr:HlyD family efflux transporter periplasmic adaptor subunit [Alloprevotella sp.]